MVADPILDLLKQHGNLRPGEVAERLGLDLEDVRRKIENWERSGVILGYHTVVNPAKVKLEGVSAFIEVKVSPERGGGFNSLAKRIAKFDQVVACYLASGRYDLMVIAEGKDLMEIASFVSEKLSTINGVLSTETHFRLKVYKENGFLMATEEDDERLPVTP